VRQALVWGLSHRCQCSLGLFNAAWLHSAQLACSPKQLLWCVRLQAVAGACQHWNSRWSIAIQLGVRQAGGARWRLCVVQTRCESVQLSCAWELSVKRLCFLMTSPGVGLYAVRLLVPPPTIAATARTLRYQAPLLQSPTVGGCCEEPCAGPNCALLPACSAL
jgi:hypothetical protein